MIIDRYYKWYNEREDTDRWQEKHPMLSTTNILIQTLLNTKNYSTTFKKPSSL
jgi:hypothetical protein